ncbi:MAG: S1 RNA-binding domain-containing protein [Butyricimonas paravirosa]
MLARPWNSKWLRSTKNSKTLLSHKALIELVEQRRKISSLSGKGQVLEGTVKNITSYGIFIDLGGVDGLIHITDLLNGESPERNR